MIPRILHFIWFGRNRPKYVDYSISGFMKTNPQFKLDFVENPSDFGWLLDDVRATRGPYSNEIQYYKSLGRGKYQILSNILRLHLLNSSGGIYLDCDCFPISPFDDWILEEDFVVKRLYQRNFPRRDCFFMGKTLESENITSYMTFPAREIQISDAMDMLNPSFIWRREMFKQCRLTEFRGKGRKYIEHFNLGAWKHDTH